MSVDGPPASGSLPISEPPSLVGQTLDGRYRIIRKLGEGGMGEVYAAEHVHIEKRFAIKLLRPEIVSNVEAVQRFRQEARSSSSIGHRNIIAIEDFGQMSDGRIYMCMELLNGAALNDLIQQPQPPDRLLNILIQTGHGLAAAHAKGIVHRDMKPENIFVTIDAQGQDVPKILDFGIAKVAGNDGQNNLTRTGTIFGTPFYMAPEQALGNPVDARTDIYAMGVIAYEVFAGSLPFQGESFMGILTQHITTEPEPVAQRAAKAGRPMPPGLAEIITRCMQKNPAQRFATMDELVNALVQVYRGVAGAGMSTYMEAFPVSARHPATTPPPMTGPLTAAHAATVAPNYTPHAHPAQPHAGPPTGPVASASGSGLYDPSASVVQVPKKGKAGLIIAIVAVLAVGGAIAAVVVMGGKKDKGAGGGSAGSQVAVVEPGSGSAGGGTTTDHGSAGSGSDPWQGSAGSAAAPPDAADAGSSAVITPPDAADSGSAGSGSEPPPLVDAGVATPEAVGVLVLAKNGASYQAFEHGEKIFDGPDVLQVVPGTPRTLTIRAKGYKETKVVVDGKKKKLTFKLDRIPGQRPDPVPTPAVNCTRRIVEPTNKACVNQFCAANPDDLKCSL